MIELEILSIPLSRIKNENHVQFHTSVDTLVATIPEDTHSFGGIYPMYADALGKEKEALDYMRQSDMTDQIATQDKVRCNCYRGIADTLKGMTRHFDPKIRESAVRLNKVFTFYGNIALKPIDARTAAITDLCNEITGQSYSESMANLKIMTEWVTKLQEENNKLQGMMMKRFNESKSKTRYRMRTSRKITDKFYRAIINNLQNDILTGEESQTFIDFITELNAIIVHYRSRISNGGKSGEKPEDEA
jgi:uncharacterized protein YciW